MDVEKRITKIEERQDKLDEKITTILQEISSFKPILKQIDKSINKLSENSVDKERVVKLEGKVDELEKELQDETIKKKSKFLEEIFKYIVLAIVGVAIGYFIK